MMKDDEDQMKLCARNLKLEEDGTERADESGQKILNFSIEDFH